MRALSVFEVDKLRIYTDSELMASQVKGEYKVKDKALRSLNTQVMSMLRGYREWEIEHIPREKNVEADLYANRAINEGAQLEGRSGKKSPPPPQGQPQLFDDA